MTLKEKIGDVISETAKGWLDNSDEIVEAIVAVVTDNANGQCPFCKEKDFDLPGLKWHVLNNCSDFRDTESIN